IDDAPVLNTAQFWTSTDVSVTTTNESSDVNFVSTADIGIGMTTEVQWFYTNAAHWEFSGASGLVRPSNFPEWNEILLNHLESDSESPTPATPGTTVFADEAVEFALKHELLGTISIASEIIQRVLPLAHFDILLDSDFEAHYKVIAFVIRMPIQSLDELCEL